MKLNTYGSQDLDERDIEQVINVLNSDFLTQGPMVPSFESAICQITGSSFGIAVNSATSALHIACLSLGLTNDDIVWTSPNSFVSSANCALMCGAKVDFVDINPETYNICTDSLRQKLLKAKLANKLPKILIPVHFAGASCDMYEIYKLSKEYGFKIIEDASHAVGAIYRDTLVGSCKFSDITVFSFHPVKMITTGEGGVALTNSKTLYEKMKLLRSHGVTRENSTESTLELWEYQQICLGFNYRMTDIQASLGITQLHKLEYFLKRRKDLVDNYFQILADLPICLPQRSQLKTSSWHLFVIQLSDNDIERKSAIFQHLKSLNIGVNVHYQPIHTQPFYKNLDKYDLLDKSEKYYAKALTLPLHTKLSNDDQLTVRDTLKNALLQL